MLDVTKMSSRGQIVIPEGIRKGMKLKPGDCFVVHRNRAGYIELRKIEVKTYDFCRKGK